MTTTNDLLRIGNTMMAVNLVGANLKAVKKKKKTTKDIVDLGVSNLVGSSLIKANADFIGE
jgi:hypothetical protein